jgi:sodium transport system permease protein
MDVKDQIINLGMCYGDNFDRNLKAGEAGKIELFYRGADEEEFVRFEAILKEQKEVVVDQRLTEKGLSNGYIEPFEIVKKNQSTFKEIIGKYAGGILPYIFMSFCFMGCMLPAIDLFAGEKERGTIETLLTTPVNRMQILTGKMIVVVAFGLVSATVALVGLFLSLQMVKDGGEFIALISDILTPSLLITLYLLLIPIAIFFAGIMIPISVYSRSFKEAQSILTPLNVAVIIPTLVGFIPGMELDYTTAFIPIVNVVLATKAVIAGNAEILPLLITFVSLLLLSAIAILISLKQFGKEENILR